MTVWNKILLMAYMRRDNEVKTLKILAIVFAIIALIGLIRFVGRMSIVNAGVFIFPAIISIAFTFVYIQKSKKE